MVFDINRIIFNNFPNILKIKFFFFVNVRFRISHVLNIILKISCLSHNSIRLIKIIRVIEVKLT